MILSLIGKGKISFGNSLLIIFHSVFSENEVFITKMRDYKGQSKILDVSIHLTSCQVFVKTKMT